MAAPDSPNIARLRSRLQEKWGDDPDSVRRADEAIAVFAAWFAELRVGRSRILSALKSYRSERRRVYRQLIARFQHHWDLRAELELAHKELERSLAELERAYEEMDRYIGWSADDEV